MNLFPALQERYTKERLSALEAQRLAHEISFGPIIFQVSRLMKKFGILQMLIDSKKGLTLDEVTEKTKLSKHACQQLLTSSLTIGTVLYSNEKFICSKAGWFLLNDPLVKADMDFIHDVNYLGLFYLEEALLNGKPEGLRVLGDWSTIYEGLSQLPENIRNSWFGFDHYYSDQSFDEALPIVFENKPKMILDIGGNTGRWALRCVDYNFDVQITILDLPQQLELMKQYKEGKNGADRILGYNCNLLDQQAQIPSGFEAIWISQIFDCFSEDETTSILTRAAESMSNDTKLYIMQTFWDRQRFETASYIMAQFSIYFTALASGNGKTYHSDDMVRCIEAAGLQIETIKDGIGKGHSIITCKKK